MPNQNKNLKNNFENSFNEIIKENIIFFPIRHHSPACSFHLKKIIVKKMIVKCFHKNMA